MEREGGVNDRWFAKAVREPGHPQAHGYEGIREPRKKRGLVYHSAEGPLRVMRRIILRPGPPSWTFSNPKRGPLIQHYERGTNIWANGELDPNIRFDACESEGKVGEPLTESQIENLIDLACWYVKEEGWAAFKRRVQAWEHKEMVRFGAPPTACPSDRIPWDIIIPAVEERLMPQPTTEQILHWMALLNEALECVRLEVPLKPETKAAIHAVTKRS
jgi:hypothetical protein